MAASLTDVSLIIFSAKLNFTYRFCDVFEREKKRQVTHCQRTKKADVHAGLLQCKQVGFSTACMLWQKKNKATSADIFWVLLLYIGQQARIA